MSITTCASPLWKVFCGGPYTSHPGSYDISQNKNDKLFVKGKNKSECRCTLCVACSVSGSWNQVSVWEWQLSLNIHRLGNLKTLENSLEMYNPNLAFSENKPKELRIPETLKARDCQYLLCEIIRKKIRIKPWSLNELGEEVHLVTLCLGGFICSLLLKVSPAVLLCFLYFKFIWAGLQWGVASTGDQHGLLQLAATQPWLFMGWEVALDGTAKAAPCRAWATGYRAPSVFHSISDTITPRRPFISILSQTFLLLARPLYVFVHCQLICHNSKKIKAINWRLLRSGPLHSVRRENTCS